LVVTKALLEEEEVVGVQVNRQGVFGLQPLRHHAHQPLDCKVAFVKALLKETIGDRHGHLDRHLLHFGQAELLLALQLLGRFDEVGKHLLELFLVLR
jgi:hypothetical protein